jgi:hypothetical protein
MPATKSSAKKKPVKKPATKQKTISKKKSAPVKKATPAKKTATMKKSISMKKPKLVCGVCGYAVTVDNVCGCAEEHTLICCGKAMAKK